MRIRPLLPAALALLSMSAAIPLRAGVDEDCKDFQAYSLNQNVSARGGWSASAGSFVIVADPGNSANKVLSAPNNAVSNIRLANSANSSVSIPNNATATLFLRFRFHGTMNYSFGMSDNPTTAGDGGNFGDYESQFNHNDTTNTAHYRDAGNFDNLSPASPLLPDIWYNIWMVINNASDMTTVYIDSTTAPGGTTSALQSSSGKTAFTFRNGVASNPLTTLLIMTDGTAGTTYFDEIYIDLEAEAISPARQTRR